MTIHISPEEFDLHNAHTLILRLVDCRHQAHRFVDHELRDSIVASLDAAIVRMEDKVVGLEHDLAVAGHNPPSPVAEPQRALQTAKL